MTRVDYETVDRLNSIRNQVFNTCVKVFGTEYIAAQTMDKIIRDGLHGSDPASIDVSVFISNVISILFENYITFDMVKDKLYCKLISENDHVNGHFHEVVHDMATEYYAVLGDDYQIPITGTWVEKNVDCHLFDIAIMNTANNLQCMIFKFDPELDGIYSVTNILGEYGAMTMYYPDVLKMVCTECSVSSLYIMPLSVHEIILYTDTDNITVSSLYDMLTETNELERNETLSEYIYRYDLSTDEVTVANRE